MKNYYQPSPDKSTTVIREMGCCQLIRLSAAQ
jgi:hypothetical protein